MLVDFERAIISSLSLFFIYKKIALIVINDNNNSFQKNLWSDRQKIVSNWFVMTHDLITHDLI